MCTYKESEDGKELDDEPPVRGHASPVLDDLLLGADEILLGLDHVPLDAVGKLRLRGNQRAQVNKDRVQLLHRFVDVLHRLQALRAVCLLHCLSAERLERRHEIVREKRPCRRIVCRRGSG